MKKRSVVETRGVGTNGLFFEVEVGSGFDIEEVESFESVLTIEEREPGLSPVLASFGTATAKAEAVDLLSLAKAGKKSYSLEIRDGESVYFRARRFIVGGKDLFLDNALLNGLYGTESELLSAYAKATGLDVTPEALKVASDKVKAHLTLRKGSESEVTWQKGLRIARNPIRYLNARVSNIR